MAKKNARRGARHGRSRFLFNLGPKYPVSLLLPLNRIAESLEEPAVFYAVALREGWPREDILEIMELVGVFSPEFFNAVKGCVGNIRRFALGQIARRNRSTYRLLRRVDRFNQDYWSLIQRLQQEGFLFQAYLLEDIALAGKMLSHGEGDDSGGGSYLVDTPLVRMWVNWHRFVVRMPKKLDWASVRITGTEKMVQEIRTDLFLDQPVEFSHIFPGASGSHALRGSMKKLSPFVSGMSTAHCELILDADWMTEEVHCPLSGLGFELLVPGAQFVSLRLLFQVNEREEAYIALRDLVISHLWEATHQRTEEDTGHSRDDELIDRAVTFDESTSSQQSRQIKPSRLTWRRIIPAMRRCGVEVTLTKNHPKFQRGEHVYHFVNYHEKDDGRIVRALYKALKKLQIAEEEFAAALR